MAEVVGSYQRGTFTTPVNGTTTDATTVLGNDNDIRSSHNSHDAEAGVHLQSSTLAARPGAAAAGAGAKWLTTDGLRLYYSNGVAWSEAAYLPLVGGTMTGALNANAGLSAQGGGTLSAGSWTFTNQVISTLATGTAPLSIASTTAVTNLNADLLDGLHAAAFATAAHSHGRADLPGAVAYEDEANVWTGSNQFTAGLRATGGSTIQITATGGTATLGGGAMLPIDAVLNNSNTVNAHGITIGLATDAAVFTLGELYPIKVASVTKGAGSTITTLAGLLINDQTVATTNYAIFTGLGKVRFGDAIIGADGAAATPSHSFYNESNSGWYRAAAGDVRLAIAGTDVLKVTANGIMVMVAGAAGTPAFSNLNGDGLWGGGGNIWRLVMASNAVMNWDLAVAAQETSIALLRYHNGAAVTTGRVTVGAADSGGAGFRVLRVPN